MEKPPDTKPLDGLLIFNRIEQEVAGCKRILDRIPSPAEKHAQSLQDIEGRIQVALEVVVSRSTEEEERREKMTEIRSLDAKMKELEDTYKAGSVNTHAAYERSVNGHVASLVEKLEEACKEWKGSCQEKARNIVSIDLTEDDHHPTKKRILFGTPPGDGSSETRKRKRRREGQLGSKRPRLEDAQRKMTYDAVYQQGRAPFKKLIIKKSIEENEPERFWVVRCEQHDFSPKENPLQGGATHLSRGHKLAHASFESVLKTLGYEVTGCDDKKAKKNNIAARVAWKKAKEARKNGQHQAPAADIIRVANDEVTPSSRPGVPEATGSELGTNKETSRKRGREEDVRNKRPTRASVRHNGPHGNPVALTDPKPGNVYLVWWPDSKQWYAALCLSLIDEELEEMGVYETIENMGLLNDLPSYYQYDSLSKAFSYSQGYENGPKDSEKELPFMFFDGRRFPGKCQVAWVDADTITPWDESQARLIEHSQQAIEYIREREANTSKTSQRDAEDTDLADSDDAEEDGEPRFPPPAESADQQPNQDPEPIAFDTIKGPITTEEVEIAPSGRDTDSERATQTDGQTDNSQETPPTTRDNTATSTQKKDPDETKDEPEAGPTTESCRDRLSTVDLAAQMVGLEEHFEAYENQTQHSKDKPTAPAAPYATQMEQVARNVMDQGSKQGSLQFPFVSADSQENDIPQLQNEARQPREGDSQKQPLSSYLSNEASRQPQIPSDMHNFQQASVRQEGMFTAHAQPLPQPSTVNIPPPRPASYASHPPPVPASPYQPAATIPRPNSIVYGHDSPRVPASPYQTAANIPRPQTAAGFPSRQLKGSPIPPEKRLPTPGSRPSSSRNRPGSFQDSLPPIHPIKQHGPTAGGYARPGRGSVSTTGSRRDSHSSTHGRSYSHAGRSRASNSTAQVTNSTATTYSSTRQNSQTRPWVYNLPTHVVQFLLERTSTPLEVLMAGSYLNSSNQYECPGCRGYAIEADDFTRHLQLGCSYMPYPSAQPRESNRQRGVA
ncbi:hypothetical protein F66182_9731 [Fusarium sp. NRRL 66182]|nr:hypothetical protein F66182_9731 [Fusarium sp. NRRL 66182]